MTEHAQPRGADTEWPAWEVFQQQRRGDAFEHVGAVHASDGDLALLMAKEQFARRGKMVQLWVVPSDAIVASPLADSDIYDQATDKSYREAFGYRLAQRKRALVREVEARQGKESAS
ncbi:MAG: 1,2-phenylacetyl-CoA epoxidase subunit B [Ardenticatenales bacterium]|nr:1,2-phenylacetyl-CoA epoxidase subunit B [Ardenticatenales bacterium]MCB9171755.1 1,2-phenylacetyl-CoA epoxidase subunit B [Ardenticatenales bacterium]